MADLSDVTSALAALASSAVYPSGTGQPSVCGLDTRIFEGWPLSQQLDLDMSGEWMQGTPPKPAPRPGGKVCNVSVYPLPGATAEVYQLLDSTYTVVNPNYGLTTAVAGNVITVTGAPVTGEFLTVILYVGSMSGKVISSNKTTVPAILNDLMAQAASLGFTLTTDGISTLTIVSNVWSFVVRQGSVGTLAKVTHRQRQAITIIVWAPDYRSRIALAAAIDVLIKENLIITMPDTSQCKLTYNRTSVSDDLQLHTIYRRDLVYDAEYATLQQFPGYVITSATFNIQGGNWGVVTNPPTITIDP